MSGSGKRLFALALLALLAGPARAQVAQPAAPGLDEASQRLMSLLQEIPRRWDQVNDPGATSAPSRFLCFPPPEGNVERMAKLLLALPGAALADRAAMVREEALRQPFTEVDFCWTEELVAELLEARHELAPAIVEAWLLWGEALGRRDVLLSAASEGIDLLQDHGEIEAALAIARSWLDLVTDGAEREKARLHQSYAELLHRQGATAEEIAEFRRARDLFARAGDGHGEARAALGEGSTLLRESKPREALASFREARKLFQAVGFPKGEAIACRWEADSLYDLGDREGALTAYRQAREMFVSLGDFQRQGITERQEGMILSELGRPAEALAAYQRAAGLFQKAANADGWGQALLQAAQIEFSELDRNQQALETFRSARAVFEAAGDPSGQGEAWKGEGEVLFFLSRNQEAVEAFRRAFGFFEAVQDKDGLGSALRGEAEALLHLGGQNELALATYDRARGYFEASGNRSGEARVWRGEAEILFLLGRNDEALAAYRRARDLFEADGNLSGKAATWIGEAEVQLLLGHGEDAIGLYESAQEVLERIGNRLELANALKSEADAHLALSQFQSALEGYRKARSLFEEKGDTLGQGNTLRGEGDALSALGKDQEALDALEKALALYRSIGYRQGEANSMVRIAKLLKLRGDFHQALQSYRGAEALYQGFGDPLGQAQTVDGQADILLSLGQSLKSLDTYRRADGLFEAIGYVGGRAYSQSGEASSLLRLDRWQEALTVLHGARDLFESAGDRLGVGNSLSKEGDILLLQGAHAQALAAYRSALAVFDSIQEPLGRANALLGIAWTLAATGRLSEAAEAVAKARAAFDSIAIGSEGRLSTVLLEATIQDRLGESAAAIQTATEALRLHSELRKSWITDLRRSQFDETIARAFDVLVPLLAASPGQEGEALRLAEEARSRVLLDLLAVRPGREALTSEVGLLAESRRITEELWRLENELAQTAAPPRRLELEAERRGLLQELEWNRYERLASLENPLPQAPPLDTAGIQKVAGETGPLLLFYVARLETWAFLILPEAPEVLVYKIELPRDLLSEKARNLVRDLANPIYEPRAREQARELWDLLVAPVAGNLPESGPLVVIPHGPLHELPFEALLDPAGRFLFERWELSVSPSVSALATARQRHEEARPVDSFFALSSGPGLNLPAEEIVEISAFFGANKAAFKPTEARFENYEKIGPVARHLLIATRGIHVQGSSTETYLEIRPTPEAHDSRLTAAEIASIPLKVELVTLAACDTSHGEAFLSDERLDLTRAFLIAGAASVLATRWKVPEDANTSRFLADFYRAYRQGSAAGMAMHKDKALSEARRLSRLRGDAAQVWAAWVLVGDAR